MYECPYLAVSLAVLWAWSTRSSRWTTNLIPICVANGYCREREYYSVLNSLCLFFSHIRLGEGFMTSVTDPIMNYSVTVASPQQNSG